MNVTTHRPPAFTCPFKGCGKKLDAVAGGVDPPKPGDFTVCAYCINWLVFDPEMKPRLITEDEIADLNNTEFVELSAYSFWLTSDPATKRLMKERGEKRRRDS